MTSRRSSLLSSLSHHSPRRLRSLFFHYEEDIRNGLKLIAAKGAKQSDEQLTKLLSYFLYCLQPAVRTKIQVFSLDGDHDLDDTIFQAIIQGLSLLRHPQQRRVDFFLSAKQKRNAKSDAGVQREQLLLLALAWDALAVAKEYIIKDDLNDLNVSDDEEE